MPHPVVPEGRRVRDGHVSLDVGNGMSAATTAAMAKVEDIMGPSKFRDELRATAKTLVTEGKGLLACDEPPHVLPGRMKMCYDDVAVCDEAWRIK